MSAPAAAPRWPARSTWPSSTSRIAPPKTQDRILVLITDGQVGNEDQILSTLGRRLNGIRVFTLGIDQAVNEGFLRRLAERGGGACELVESESRLDEVMQSIHRRIATPLLMGLHLESEGIAIEPGEIVPCRLPDLMSGSPLLILGRYRGRAEASVDGSRNGPYGPGVVGAAFGHGSREPRDRLRVGEGPDSSG